MTQPGLMARSIRLSNGFSQKEIYTGIVSKSFAISFEKGKVMLNHYDFLQVLERLCVSLQEFEFVRGGYCNSDSVSLWKSFALAANSKNRRQLKALYEQHRTDKSDYSKVIAYLAHSILSSFPSPIPEPSSRSSHKESRFLMDYLMKKESWMLEEINLFSSYYYLFDADTQRLFIQSCYTSLQRYAEYPHYEERMYNLLSNYISYCYTQHRREEGDQWLLQLRALPKNTAYMHQMIHAKLCEAHHLAAHGQADAGRALTEECAGMFAMLGFRTEADNAKHSYEALITSYQSTE